LSKTALVTGISGQDGAYLAALLVEKGYQVTGAARRSASGDLWRLRELDVEPKVELVDLELAEYSNVEDVIRRVKPDEVYNLAAQSFVTASFEVPVFTSDVNALGVLRLLEAVRRHAPEARFYQASTSEMFGKVRSTPQDEETPFHPRSPYGVSKVFAHWATVNYREAWDLFTASGILFNHESPLRGEEFVTRKITRSVARRATGGEGPLRIGNLDARRDWGFAGDYVQAMWAMLQADHPDDYVVASGTSHSVREFVTLAHQAAGFDLEWVGEGASEKGLDPSSGDVVVEVSKEFFRPAEVDCLVGDATKARQELGFDPSVSFEELVELMVRRDIERMAGA
jgi:GDPmannose 4,6-dehydratase